MKQAGSIEIDREITEVFRLTTEHVAEWSLVVVEDEAIDQKPEGVGSTFRTVTEERGKRMTFEGVVTKQETPYHMAVKMVGDAFDIEAEYTFEDLGGRTRVTQDSVVTGKGFSKIMLKVFGGLMKKSSCEALTKELESLKTFCEK